jgi:ribosomal-protein-alanine N-acetyltransferase
LRYHNRNRNVGAQTSTFITMNIPINSEYYLSPPNEGDIPAFINHLHDREIYDRTLMIPYPYTESDAKWFLKFCEATDKSFGHTLNFAIRNSNHELIGVAGFHGKNIYPPVAHKDEVGYWIAKPFWQKGIMSAALPALIKYGEEVRGIRRFEAPIYASNIASEKVLRKCGFKEEGFLEKAYFKNGKYMDGKIFALVK